MTDVTLYVVRHGQTYYNIYNKLQGWSNSPLTEKGILDAQRAGDRLKNVTFKTAYCSDTTRAEQTARTILTANEAHSATDVTVSPLFREQFYGYYEGANMDETWYVAGAPHGLPTFKAIVNQYDIGTAKDFLKAADPFHDAENNEEYWTRWDQALDTIRHDSRLEDGDNVLLVSHGNTLLSLMERYGDGAYDLTERPKNGSLTKLALTPADVQVISYNE
ncbi:histidine phosphatase family protein [Levilactobacillus bambusae]|uniref:Histidine phosphatase family protein n=1 Tax=Levilactobacillus bambusae TaxID=2024736 RepID=A0A2V1MYI5_9LACO|nr:histidine phosphatase family protein [Levilactobacillus bambusae]PWG00071.1 histidine phosphatase family protein [Levilactobacillus bambusae]